MNLRRRAYRPEVVGRLEDRMVLSAVAPVNLAAFEHGSQLRPLVVATFQGSDQARIVSRSGKPLDGQFTYSAQEVALNVPNGGGPAVGTFKVDYHNESSKAITSATIVETLAPGLEYVPGSSHVPPDGRLTVWSNPKGDQILQLDLPGGIASGAEGYFEFEAEQTGPSRR